MFIHYKDLDRICEPATVLLDHSALDVWEYWFNRAVDSGLVIDTVDITDLVGTLPAWIWQLQDRSQPEIHLHFVADATNSSVAELLYHRGCDTVSWDLRQYTPVNMPIPEHCMSTPELSGLLTVGGQCDTAWAHAGLWCDGSGVIPGVDWDLGTGAESISNSLWQYCGEDFHMLLNRYHQERFDLYTAHWQRAFSGIPEFPQEVCVNLPHTQRFAQEHRRQRHCVQQLITGAS